MGGLVTMQPHQNGAHIDAANARSKMFTTDVMTMKKKLRMRKTFSSQFVGVVKKNTSKWQAKRHSKHAKKDLHNGIYDNEEKAARASDTLARKLIANGEKAHKLNFPNDDSEVLPKHQKKRKRTHHEDLGHPKNN